MRTSLFLADFAGLGITRYILIFFGMMVEGDIALFTSGFLAQRGYINPWVGMVVTFCGTMTGDILWFSLSRKIKNRSGKFWRLIEKLSRPFDLQIQKYPLHTLLISKYSIGMHRAMIFRLGSIGTTWKKFFKYNLTASGLWIIGIGALGFLSGASFDLVQRYVHYGEIALLIGLLVFIGFSYWFSKIEEP